MKIAASFRLAPITMFFLAMTSCGSAVDRPDRSTRTAGNGVDAATTPDEKIGQQFEIVFSHCLQGQSAAAIEDLVTAFDQSRDDLNVRISREQRAGRTDSLEQTILSGTGPDVFLAGDMFAMDWIERKHVLQPLDRLMASRGSSPGQSIQARYLARVSSAGLTYGMPLAISVPLLVVNPDVVKREFNMAAAPTANASRPIGLDASDWMMTAAFLGAFDATLVDGTGMPAFDSEGASRAVDFVMQNLASGGLMSPENGVTVIDMFNSGKVNAAIVWPDQVSLISNENPWIAMPMPFVEGAGRVAPLWQVDTLFISSWSRHYDAAADLVAWLTTRSGIESLTRDGFFGLFVGENDLPDEYAATPLSRAIRTQQAGAVPSPAFQSTRIAADIFATTVVRLLGNAGMTTDTVGTALAEDASRARAAVTKIRQGQSVILR